MILHGYRRAIARRPGQRLRPIHATAWKAGAAGPTAAGCRATIRCRPGSRVCCAQHGAIGRCIRSSGCIWPRSIGSGACGKPSIPAPGRRLVGADRVLDPWPETADEMSQPAGASAMRTTYERLARASSLHTSSSAACKSVR